MDVINTFFHSLTLNHSSHHSQNPTTWIRKYHFFSHQCLMILQKMPSDNCQRSIFWQIPKLDGHALMKPNITSMGRGWLWRLIDWLVKHSMMPYAPSKQRAMWIQITNTVFCRGVVTPNHGLYHQCMDAEGEGELPVRKWTYLLLIGYSWTKSDTQLLAKLVRRNS